MDEWSDTLNSTGVYGIQGVPADSNTPPALYQAVQWTDKSGNFWIFGGAELNSDLWKFDPANNIWTWINGTGQPEQIGIYGVQGLPSPSNVPGARTLGCSSWTDANGELWLFGGIGIDGMGNEGALNDLWRYNISTNEWTWMAGPNTNGSQGSYGIRNQSSPTNLPPARDEVNCSWLDQNNRLWLFAGYDDGGDCYNDLWQYDIANGKWTWMTGGEGVSQPGNYGTIGVPAPTNVPPPRWSYTHWVDGQGNFYTFGGLDCNGILNSTFNDVWKFDVNSNYWTWIAGYSYPNSNGNYDQFCTGTNDEPRARFENRAAEATQLGLSSCNTLLFMFGGATKNDHSENVNDLWVFNTLTNRWKWISGSSGVNSIGDYGIIGQLSGTNLPPARGGHCFWADNRGNLWLFGGANFTSSYNDMWEFIPDSSCIMFGADTISASSNKNQVCANDTAQLCAQSGFTTFRWNTGDTTQCINTQLAGNYVVTVSENGNCSAVSNIVTLDVYTPPPVSITVNHDTLTGYNAVSYQWLLNGDPIAGATSYVFIVQASGSYALQITDSNGCTATSVPVNITGIVNQLTDNSISIYPNPSNTGWHLSVSSELLGSMVEVFDATGRLVFQSAITNKQSTIEIPEAATGVYELHINSYQYTVVRKLVKM